MSDAEGVRDVLKSRYHTDHVGELFNGGATRTATYGKLRWLGKNTKPADSVLIYYAGHGHIDDSRTARDVEIVFGYDPL